LATNCSQLKMQSAIVLIKLQTNNKYYFLCDKLY